MKLVRGLAAILAGALVFALVVGLLTPVVNRAFRIEDFQSFSLGLLAATVGYTVAGAVAGGYITAWIAGRRELPHAAALGLLMIAMGILSMRQHDQTRPGWYETTLAGCGPVAALFGAALRRLRR